MATHDQRTRRKIRAGNDLDQFFGADLRVVDIGFAGGNHFAGIMRRDVGCHTNGNPVGTIYQKVGIFSWQNRWFKLRFVIVLGKFDCVFVNVAKQALRRSCKP